MIDTWAKKSPSGKSVMFKIEGDRAIGFVYSAKMEGRDVAQITTSLEELTREQVEARFADYVTGKEADSHTATQKAVVPLQHSPANFRARCRKPIEIVVRVLNGMNSKLVKHFPQVVEKIDGVLEAIFGVILHPALAIVLALVSVVIGLVGGFRFIPIATFGACLVVWLWAIRATPIKELHALPRLGVIVVLALTFVFAGTRFQRWALNAYNQQKAADASPVAPQIKWDDKHPTDRSKSADTTGEHESKAVEQPTVKPQEVPKRPVKQSTTKPQPQSPIIQTQAPYGNLAARCEELGNAIISTADSRQKSRPNPATNRLEYNEWYRQNDGLYFHGPYYRDIAKIHKELSDLHVDDPRLDELIERHETYFALRQRMVQQAIDYPMNFHLSIEEIREIGERFKRLATQIPR